MLLLDLAYENVVAVDMKVKVTIAALLKIVMIGKNEVFLFVVLVFVC